jgi:nicotinamidase-related amidase
MDGEQTDRAAAGGVGLLIIDMINDLDFEDSESFLPPYEAALDVVMRLKRDAQRLGVPVIYVNDNYGQWRSDREEIVRHCLENGPVARDAIARIRPEQDDFFVVKPQVSGFYATTLPVLLPRLDVNRLVLTGVAADICVLFTAADAHMRQYDLWVPADAVASSNPQHTDWALQIMRKSMGAEVRPTGQLDLEAWVGQAQA